MALAYTSSTPSTGPTSGGTKVVITGTGLDTVDDVLFGTHSASIDTTAANTATSLTVISPAIPNADAGAVTIFLVDNDTLTEVGSPVSFTYTVVTTPVLTSSLARKWKIDVDTSTGQDGTGYTNVRAVMDLQPQIAATMQDDSDYDSNGWGSDVKTMLKWSLVLKLGRKFAAGNAEDPGQAALRAAHDQFGSAGVVRVRWYDRAGGSTEAYEGYAQVQWSEDGGNTSALSQVSCTLTGQGERTAITNPA